jgi:hypothetical protein
MLNSRDINVKKNSYTLSKTVNKDSRHKGTTSLTNQSMREDSPEYSVIAASETKRNNLNKSTL